MKAEKISLVSGFQERLLPELPFQTNASLLPSRVLFPEHLQVSLCGHQCDVGKRSCKQLSIHFIDLLYLS